MADKRYTSRDFVDPDRLPGSVRPFRSGEFVDNEDGTRSTERTMSINIDGKEVLAPTLWMTRDGPVDLSRNPETLVRAIQEFERKSGKKFPRFDTPDEATDFAKKRSSAGAVSTSPLER